MGKLSDLEAAILAVVVRRGPVTGYSVRDEFGRSVTDYWSSSAGSVYRAINRLVANGAIEAEAKPKDGRGTHNLMITPKGLAAFEQWVTEVPATLPAPFDLARTKALFSFLLSPERRNELLGRMTEATAKAEKDALQIENQLLADGQVIDALFIALARSELRHRRTWLDQLQKEDGGLSHG